jgi:hypothetical protein
MSRPDSSFRPRRPDIIASMTRGRRWMLGAALACLALGLTAYAARRQLVRAAAAIKIYRARIFTPPPQLPGESRFPQFAEAAEFYWDFAAIPLEREKRLKLLNPELKPLVKEIDRRQASGEDMHYSMHIYREIRWRLNFTPDIQGVRDEIARLRQSLADPNAQKQAQQQQASDGSWAMGIDAWYLRLYYSVDEAKACKAPPQYPLAFLDRINSPERLNTQLDADLNDAFTRTGIFNREETDETFSAIARLLFATNPSDCYKFDPRLRDALAAFVQRWQNPETGLWGQWLVDRHGRVWKMDDVGMTFHVVSDLHGAVDHKDKIARRMLQLDRVNFPAGILFDGHYENHLNWDAVKILRMAWPELDEATRQKARAEIARMLDWCLSQSYQPDGSFKVSDLDDTPGDAFRYGIWFLEEAGYFERKDRFWTDRDFPQAGSVRERIEARLQSTGLVDPAMREAYDTLHAMD